MQIGVNSQKIDQVEKGTETNLITLESKKKEEGVDRSRFKRL